MSFPDGTGWQDIPDDIEMYDTAGKPLSDSIREQFSPVPSADEMAAQIKYEAGLSPDPPPRRSRRPGPDTRALREQMGL